MEKSWLLIKGAQKECMKKAALFARKFFIKMRQGTGAAREVKAS